MMTTGIGIPELLALGALLFAVCTIAILSTQMIVLTIKSLKGTLHAGASHVVLPDDFSPRKAQTIMPTNLLHSTHLSPVMKKKLGY